MISLNTPILNRDYAVDAVRACFRADVITGLSARTKTLPCKYLYDAEGSRLFDRICELPEYYPTRTEYGILRQSATELARIVGSGAGVLEFGAGALVKIRLLLRALHRPTVYVPIDISRSHLLASAARLSEDFPALTVAPVCADFTKPLKPPKVLDSVPGQIVGFFPGSTIGNFTPREAIAFLKSAHRLLGAGSLMILGVDLVKDEHVLLQAYDDAAGVTAAFNLNLLTRINRELGANFVPERFAHAARWNPDDQRVEMHLVSRCRQRVHIQDSRFDFDQDESIHTENSYKYSIQGFHSIAESAGFRAVRHWTDPERLFSVHLLQADGPPGLPHEQARPSNVPVDQ